MSTETPTTQTTSDDIEWETFVDEHREEIEREAASDAPDAWVFQRILNYVDGDES